MVKNEDTAQKTSLLFMYLRELCKLRTRVIKNIKDHKANGEKLAYIEMRNYEPNLPGIQVLHTFLNEETEQSDVILRINKVQPELCPYPGDELLPWLPKDWDDPDVPTSHLNSRKLTIKKPVSRGTDEDSDDSQSVENARNDLEESELELFFFNSKDRVEQYLKWKDKRERWKETEKRANKSRELFQILYGLYKTWREQKESVDLMLGNGCLTDSMDSKVSHPILLKKIEIQLEAEKNTIIVRDSEEEPEVYNSLLNSIEGLDVIPIKRIEDRIKEQDIHPLDIKDGDKVLREITGSITSNSRYYGPDEIRLLRTGCKV